MTTCLKTAPASMIFAKRFLRTFQTACGDREELHGSQAIKDINIDIPSNQANDRNQKACSGRQKIVALI